MGSLVCQAETYDYTCTTELYSSGYIKTIMILEPCGGLDCEAGTIVNITVTDLKNPRSTRPIENSFEIRSFTYESYPIDIGTITQANGLEITVAPLTSVEIREPLASDMIITGALDTYRVAVMPTNGLEE